MRRAAFGWRQQSGIADLRRMTRKQQDRLQLLENELTGEIIGAFYECYNDLGFGFLESVYRRALATELRARGRHVAEEAPVEVRYKGVLVGSFRMDLLVESRVVVEVKAGAALGPTDKRQLLNYLRATNLEVGLLVHFGPEAKFSRLASQKYVRQGGRSCPAQRADPAVSASSA
jgi:GxxExxY protein